MALSDRFHRLLSGHENDPEAHKRVAALIAAAPDSFERDGLLALMYHEGIGVPVQLGRCFELAEKAAFGGHDGLGYFLLAYMCDNAEAPHRAEGGPGRKYDHYDAERFYEICAGIDSRWKIPAIHWLGDYYMDMARGGDPAIAVEYFESIAPDDVEAAGRLSDYYWELVMSAPTCDEASATRLFHWTSVAAEMAPDEYLFRLGWLYADGIGCDADTDKAVDCFSEAYAYGDWRAGRSLASILREHLRKCADAPQRQEYEAEIHRLDEETDRLYEEFLKKHPGERHDSAPGCD